jgi:very-short-patch-repair endonuclease
MADDRKRLRAVSRAIEASARRMRREPTPAEERLWRALRNRQVAGLKFRRQVATGRFVLDLYCAAAKLAIEVDGAVHDEQAERDAERTAHLHARGIRVLRFRNDDVLENLPTVLATIAEAARPHQTAPPLPFMGEGVGG